MPTDRYAPLTFDDYGAAIGAAATVLRANATSCPLDAPVPTCPGWTLSDLVVHQGMVHRWASDRLTGLDGDAPGHEAAGRAAADLLDWFDDGATRLLDVLSKTPADWDGWFFLRNASSPREGWARRQAHETTIHAVDAMSARLGRPPSADEVWFSPELAVDGIDELVTGFAPRRSTRLRSEDPLTLELRATDADRQWTVHISPEPVRVGENGAAADADVTWSAPARDLYLAVWNRVDGAGADPGERRIQIDARTEAGADARRLWTDLFTVEWA